MAEDYYQLLGVPNTATKEEIEKAFRRKGMQYHPDIVNNSDMTAAEKKAANEKYIQISTAAGVLTDPEKRAAYDRAGEKGVEGLKNGKSNVNMGPKITDFATDKYRPDDRSIYDFFGPDSNDSQSNKTESKNKNTTNVTTNTPLDKNAQTNKNKRLARFGKGGDSNAGNGANNGNDEKTNDTKKTEKKVQNTFNTVSAKIDEAAAIFKYADKSNPSLESLTGLEQKLENLLDEVRQTISFGGNGKLNL